MKYGIDFEWLLEKCTISLIVYEFGPGRQWSALGFSGVLQ